MIAKKQKASNLLSSATVMANPAPTIAIMTAKAVELNAIRRLLKVIGKDVCGDGKGHYFATLSAANGIHHVVTGKPSYGQADAAMELFDLAIAFPTVSTFIFAGVAGGTSKSELGQVVISRRVAHFDEGKFERGRFVFRGYCPEPDTELVSKADDISQNDIVTLKLWYSAIKKLFGSQTVKATYPSFLKRISPEKPPEIMVETIGTSSSVINDIDVRNKWARSGHKICAFEMEAYGVAQGSKRFNSQYIIIRSISDHAGGDKTKKKDANDQPFAAHIASACLGLLLSQLTPQPPAHRSSFGRSVCLTSEPVGLIMDVDKTLTADLIQREYAKLLGCAVEFEKIESDWQEFPDSDLFAQRLIKLFAEHGFSRQKAAEFAKLIPLQPWAARLLQFNVPKFLVSSGPNYYVRELASQFGIPTENVLCSEYQFDEQSGIICGCNSVSSNTKAMFAEKAASNYAVTIGLGDHPRDDGPFLGKVTIPILMREAGSIKLRSDTFITAPSCEAIFNLIQRLANRSNH